MRWSISVVLVVITLVGLIAACGGGEGQTDPESAPVNIADGPPIDVASQDTKMHIGKLAKVCGPVIQIRVDPEGVPGTFIYYDYKFPNFSFFIHVDDVNRGNFPEDLEGLYVGKNVCITGTIEDWPARNAWQKMQPYMAVTDSSGIEIQP